MDAKPLVKRINYIDIIKTIAIIQVIAIHTASPAILNYPIKSADWISAIFIRSAIGTAVPLFLMCTGALFLNPDNSITIRKIYTKYIPRIVICLLFWGAAYEIYDLYQARLAVGCYEKSRIIVAVKNLFTGNTHFHLYYLFIVILVYALVPIIRELLKKVSKQTLTYILILWAVLGIIMPFLNCFSPFNLISGIIKQHYLNMSYSAVGYCILGYYIHTSKKKKPIFSIGMIILGIAIVFSGTLVMSIKNQALSEIFLLGMTPGIAIMSYGIFSLAHSVEKEKINKFTFYISKASFCIYLVHSFFNMIFTQHGFTSYNFSPTISIPIITLCNLSLSVLVYFILSKIPIINKWLI